MNRKASKGVKYRVFATNNTLYADRLAFPCGRMCLHGDTDSLYGLTKHSA